MRKLKTTDVFAAARLIATIDIKEDVKRLLLMKKTMQEVTEEDIEKSIEDKGFELIYILFEKAVQKKSEKEIYNFLSEILEIPSEEVESYEPFELIDYIGETISLENWKSFFLRVAKLMKLI